ncbi:hypothetical protein J6590_018426, partial [Homalodisca vitripennis]
MLVPSQPSIKVSANYTAGSDWLPAELKAKLKTLDFDEIAVRLKLLFQNFALFSAETECLKALLILNGLLANDNLVPPGIL